MGYNLYRMPEPPSGTDPLRDRSDTATDDHAPKSTVDVQALRRLPRFWTFVALLMSAMIVLGAYEAIVKHLAFRSYAYDLGIFDQVIYHLSRFEVPESTLRRVSVTFKDHFSPMWVAYVPAYWIGGTRGLLAFQPIVLASAAVPIANFARRRLSDGWTLAIVAIYLLSPAVWGGISFDIHELSMAAPLAVLAIDLYDRGRLTWATLVIVAWLLVKEDQGLTIAMLGIIAFFRRDRLFGGLWFLIGAAWPFFVMKVVNRLVGGDGYQFWIYGHLAATPGGLALWMLGHPLALVKQLTLPLVKTKTFVATVAPVGLLGLISPYALLLLPIFLARYLGNRPFYYEITFQYGMVPAAIGAICASDGLARLRMRFPKIEPPIRLVAVTASFLVAAHYLVSKPGMSVLDVLPRGDLYHRARTLGSVRRVMDAIPADASVAGDNIAMAHLSSRKEAFAFFLSVDVPPTDYVVLSDALGPMERPISLWLRDNAIYDTVFDEAGFRIFKRNRPAPDYAARRARTMNGFAEYVKGHLLADELPAYPGYGAKFILK